MNVAMKVGLSVAGATAATAGLGAGAALTGEPPKSDGITRSEGGKAFDMAMYCASLAGLGAAYGMGNVGMSLGSVGKGLLLGAAAGAALAGAATLSYFALN